VAPFDIPREWRKAVSIDWGFNDYCDVLWHAMDGDHVYTYRELHVKGKSVREVARDIKMLTGFDEKIDYYVGSPDMWQTRGTGETIGSQNIADIFASERIYFQKANNSRVVGWQVMREYMLNAKDETPKWKIFSSCQNIIRCLPLAQYDDDKMEDMSTEPHEITDALDSARYFFMTRPSSKRISMENKPMNYTPSEVEDFLSGSTKETRKHDSVDRRRVWKQ
jgi:phage terminase large subunit